MKTLYGLSSIFLENIWRWGQKRTKVATISLIINMSIYITVSSYRELSTIQKIEEPVRWGYRSGLAPIARNPFCFQCQKRAVGL